MQKTKMTTTNVCAKDSQWRLNAVVLSLCYRTAQNERTRLVWAASDHHLLATLGELKGAAVVSGGAV